MSNGEKYWFTKTLKFLKFYNTQTSACQIIMNPFRTFLLRPTSNIIAANMNKSSNWTFDTKFLSHNDKWETDFKLPSHSTQKAFPNDNKLQFCGTTIVEIALIVQDSTLLCNDFTNISIVFVKRAIKLKICCTTYVFQ